MSPVVAHAGHWLANVAYAAPVIVLVGWLAVTKLKERRTRQDGSDEGQGVASPD